jgi:EAL domain-containing protein (putative c-di-GMP-specific phosphodiesterase class I)
MGHDLGLQVIVEGVERQSQADTLATLGATYAQGYLYARPKPGPELDSSDGRLLR